MALESNLAMVMSRKAEGTQMYRFYESAIPLPVQPKEALNNIHTRRNVKHIHHTIICNSIKVEGNVNVH